jgi:hypothetical protein
VIESDWFVTLKGIIPFTAEMAGLKIRSRICSQDHSNFKKL